MNFIYKYGRDTTLFTLHVGKTQTTAKCQFIVREGATLINTQPTNYTRVAPW